jgi:hypothetical protein
VVTAVFAEVTFFAGGLDLCGDLDSAIAREVIQLLLEPVVRLLGEPGDVGVAGFGHGYSSST